MRQPKLSTHQLLLSALFTALIAMGAFIRIPVPVVPFTLQFLFTMLAGLFLGPKLGMISVIAYIILGLVGFPVFTEGGGPGYLLQPTFGYLLGFAVATYVTGYIVHKVSRPSMYRLLTANFVGLAIVYVFGMAYYYFICNFVSNTPIGVWPFVLYCFLLAVPGDIFLCIFAAVIGKRLIPTLTAMVTKEV